MRPERAIERRAFYARERWAEIMPADVAKAQVEWERKRLVARMRQCGFKYREIAEAFGFCIARVGQLLDRFDPDNSPVERYLQGGTADLADIVHFRRRRL